jgi:hypothetical protein
VALVEVARAEVVVEGDGIAQQVPDGDGGTVSTSAT